MYPVSNYKILYKSKVTTLRVVISYTKNKGREIEIFSNHYDFKSWWPSIYNVQTPTK